METRAFAETHPNWTFDAVDPAKAMLDLAANTLAAHMDRVRMHHGYIDQAPTGPFDAATSLLTLHFLQPDARRDTAAQVRRRLPSGAPLIVMHMSFPQQCDAERELWIERHVGYLVANGIAPEEARKAREAIADKVPVLSPNKTATFCTLPASPRSGSSSRHSRFAVGCAVRNPLGRRGPHGLPARAKLHRADRHLI